MRTTLSTECDHLQQTLWTQSFWTSKALKHFIYSLKQFPSGGKKWFHLQSRLQHLLSVLGSMFLRKTRCSQVIHFFMLWYTLKNMSFQQYSPSRRCHVKNVEMQTKKLKLPIFYWILRTAHFCQPQVGHTAPMELDWAAGLPVTTPPPKCVCHAGADVGLRTRAPHLAVQCSGLTFRNPAH